MINHNVKNIIITIAAILFAAIDVYKYEKEIPQDQVERYLYTVDFYTYNSLVFILMGIVSLLNYQNWIIRLCYLVIVAINVVVILKIKIDLGDVHRWWDWVVFGAIFALLAYVTTPQWFKKK